MSARARKQQAARSRWRDFLRPTLAEQPVKWRTPPDIARELGVEPAKIIGLIDSGELHAVNIAQHTGPGRRARWRIKQEWFDEFLASRGNQKPAPTPQRRQRRERYVPRYYK